MIIDEIDFAELYREHIRRACRRPKPASDWDKRAEEMSETCADPDDPYVFSFIARMRLEGAKSLLDVGCGPGTICLPLARRLERVFALDFSTGMLNVLKQRAAAEGLNNVRTFRRSWADSWDDVPVCDLVVASRSTMVGDMEDALLKLNSKAKRYVYTTHTVDRHFIADGIMECLGRSTVGFPNYIYTVNLLHRMGYLPHIDFITTALCKKNSKSRYECKHDGGDLPPGFEPFLQSVQWSIGELSAEEIERLKGYYEDHGKDDTRLIAPSRTWAFVSWAVGNRD